MKNQFTLIICVLTMWLNNAQEYNLETKSVAIENLITFIVEEVQPRSNQSEVSPRHIVFLIESPHQDFDMENKTILKQAFKLVSQRLLATDNISIIAYYGQNGIVLSKTSASQVKTILHTIDQYSHKIKPSNVDGRTLAYDYIEQGAVLDEEFTIVMVRNSNLKSKNQSIPSDVSSAQATKPNKGNAVLLTAISLLPQLISVIKD